MPNNQRFAPLTVPFTRKIFGYFVGAITSSTFYIVWVLVLSALLNPYLPGLLSSILFALFFWLFGGFAAALALMSLPWFVAIRIYHGAGHLGPLYFSSIGALGIFLIGCATASLSPKPLFIEDQTFLQGYIIAAQRQGICLSLAGVVFGVSYWFITEKWGKVSP